MEEWNCKLVQVEFERIIQIRIKYKAKFDKEILPN